MLGFNTPLKITHVGIVFTGYFRHLNNLCMTLFSTFRSVAIFEGISYLLFAVTMPLKYGYDILEPNYYVGMAHGILFMLYCFLGLASAIHYKWKVGFSVWVFIASLVPFGTFYLHAKYLKKMDGPQVS